MPAKNTSATPADVAAKAEEKKDTIPAQAESADTTEEKATDAPELTLVEGGKKSFVDRVNALTEKAKENKAAAVALGVALAITAGVLIKNRLGLTDEDESDFVNCVNAVDDEDSGSVNDEEVAV